MVCSQRFTNSTRFLSTDPTERGLTPPFPAPPTTSPRVPSTPQHPRTGRWPADDGSSRVGEAVGPSASMRGGFTAVSFDAAEKFEELEAAAPRLRRPLHGLPALHNIIGRGAGHFLGVRDSPTARTSGDLGRCHHLSSLAVVVRLASGGLVEAKHRLGKN